MDKEAHSVVKNNPDLSYNDINWTLIKRTETEKGVI
jgi:hypothetical protein